MSEPEYQATIGLEIHAELKTHTKMFCDSLNNPDETRPNVNVCPVCMGHPGTLPVPNKQAIEYVIKVGLALGSEISGMTKFDRKNYFYPDIPKAYQISQYDKPIVKGGMLRGVRITRVHLEEDTATLSHVGGVTLVDYNRSSVPLMELVTEPDLRSADEVAEFARELQRILRYLGVSDANMEKGQMRIEANISLNMGTKAEVKNINSFKAVHDAVEYEIARQTEVLKSGGKLVQETRGWDEVKQSTFSQRSKEDAHDYRYFPEPDIPPFETNVFDIAALAESLPELPEAKRVRFIKEYKLDAKSADAMADEPAMADYFEAAVSEFRETVPDGDPATIYNYLTSDLRGLMKQANVSFGGVANGGGAILKVNPEHLAHLAALIGSGKITSRQAKDMLAKMFATGDDPEAIMKSENIGISDAGEVEETVRAIIAENAAAVADYKKGKTASLQFLIGKAMGKLKGRAKPDMLSELFEKNLK
jgi:aspartyl-tRNA(Asn)/glutamyl-tRNA(Gln) amidotransferase subunit B